MPAAIVIDLVTPVPRSPLFIDLVTPTPGAPIANQGNFAPNHHVVNANTALFASPVAAPTPEVLVAETPAPEADVAQQAAPERNGEEDLPA